MAYVWIYLDADENGIERASIISCTNYKYVINTDMFTDIKHLKSIDKISLSILFQQGERRDYYRFIIEENCGTFEFRSSF